MALLAVLLLEGPTPVPTTDEAPRGVMVSLDSLEPGLPPPSAVDSSTLDTAAPTPGTPTPATETAAPVGPEQAPAGPAPATDIGPQPQVSAPADPDTAPPSESVDSENQQPAPRIADAVTIKPADSIETIGPDEQITARAETQAAEDDSGPRPDASADANGGFGSSEQATDDYIVRLRAWLSRHKQYPMAARSQKIEGTVRVYLVIDADGTVISQRILESSGSELLDEAARQMLTRSQPLPRMSASMRRNRLELVVPVVFALR